MTAYTKSELNAADISSPRMENKPGMMPSDQANGEPLAYAPIAIIGMDCRVPGADGPDAFWDLLMAGQTVVGGVPPERKRLTDYQGGEQDAWRWGGFLQDIECFDAPLFGISPREAQSIDPQQRLLLEGAWRALESANIAPDSLAGSMTGVFVGISWNDYLRLQRDYAGIWDPYSGTGTALSVAANRISYCFNLQGPSMAIDTACSSSLVAVHQACSSLASGESSLALAGGVNLVLYPDVSEIYASAQMLSPSGRCWTFDERADGYVRSEGCGMVVLKRLSDAQRDGDRIRGVIRGSAVNQDGRTEGLSAPSGAAQQKVIRSAMKQAGFSSGGIGYMEAHGTGTPLGDTTEANALRQLMDAQEDGQQSPCWLGAAKSVIGHMESAAGIAGLIKAVLVLQHGRVPPNANFGVLNPTIDLGKRLRIPVQPVEWPAPAQHPRRAGVTSFGFGGANASVMLEAFSSDTVAPATLEAPGDERNHFLLALSAHSENSLRAMASRYGRLIADTSGPHELASICRTANTSRARLPERLAASGDASELAAVLRRFADGGAQPHIGLSRGWAGQRPRIAFLFTGQGSQYAGMGHGLYLGEPVFRDYLDRCDAILEPLLGVSIREVMFGTKTSLLDDTQYAQPALVALELALAEQWRHWGIEPDVVVGHSIGEAAAACVAGIMDLETVLRVVVERGHLMSSALGSGAMASVRAGLDDVQRMLGPRMHDICVAGINAPDQVVLSGGTEALNAVLDILKQHGVESSLLKVSHAFHSTLMDPVLGVFQSVFRDVEFHEPHLKMVTTGGEENASASNAAYWVNQLRQPVRFAPAMKELEALGADTFVEIGPAPVLINLGRRSVAQGSWIASLRSGIDDCVQMRTALGELFVEGAEADFKHLDAHRNAPLTTLPAYPFDRTEHWFLRRDGAARRRRIPAVNMSGILPLLGKRADLALQDAVCFEAALPGDGTEFLLDHRVLGRSIMPAAAYVSLALAAVQQAQLAPVGPITLCDFDFHRPLDLTDGDVRVQTVLQRQHDNTGAWHIRIAAWDEVSAHWDSYAGSIFGQQQAGDARMQAIERPGHAGEAADVAHFYSRCFEKGLEYGEQFQAVASLVIDGVAVHGEIELPAGTNEQSGVLHPVVLDAAFQMLAGLILDQDNEGHVPLPVSIEQLTFHKAHQGKIHMLGRLRPSEHKGAALVADLKLSDEQGQPIAEISGFAMAWADPSRILPRSDKDWLPAMFYQPVWSDLDMDQASTEPAAARSVLCVYPDHARPIKDAVLALHGAAACSEILLGQATRQSAGAGWEIDAADPEAFALVIKQLPRFDAVYFLGAVQPAGVAPDDCEALGLGQEHGVIALFRLLKTLSQHGYRGRSLKIRTLSNGVFAVAPTESVQASGASVVGLIKVAAKEYAEWTFSHVDAGLHELDGTPAALAAIAARLANHQGDRYRPEIAMRGGRCFRQSLHPLTIPANSPPSEQQAFKQRGVYFIVGGAGGVGLELAGYLSQTVNARLALAGRSVLTDALAQKLQKIEALGGEVLYLQADVTDSNSLAAAVRAAKERFGNLNGVVHAPLVLQDKTLDQMEEAALRAVLAPKVLGSVNLYKAVAAEPLDFLMFFSSVMSFVGNPGQANYVAANVFQDAFSQLIAQRAPYPIKTVNWGFWSEIGAVSSDYYRTRLASQGVDGISTREGMEAIGRVLGAESRQLLAFKGSAHLLSDIGADLSVSKTAYPALHAPFLPLLAQDLRAACRPEPGHWECLAEATQAEAALGRLVLLNYLRKNTTLLAAGGQRYPKEQLRKELGVDAQHLSWFEAVLEMLARSGWITLHGNEIRTTTALDDPELTPQRLEELKENTLRQFPELQGSIDLLWACGERFADVVTGAMRATEVLFPDGSMALVEAVYSGGVFSYRNQLAATCIAEYVELRISQLAPGEKLQVLEIGAGTGGTTRHVLPALRHHGEQLRYVYTDLSPAFLRHGESQFGADKAFMEFELLDIERHPQPQGFAPASFDLVLATDVLHATADIARTLTHVKCLLKHNGALVLNEITARHDLYTLTFGLLGGWWLFADAARRIEHTPLLDVEGWRRQFELQGFTAPLVLGPQGQVMIAQSDGIVLGGMRNSQRGMSGSQQPAAVAAEPTSMIAASELAMLSEQELAQAILQGVASMVGKVLRIDMARAFADEQRLADTQFSSLGVDSLMAIELRNRIMADLAVDVPIHYFIGRSLVRDVVALIGTQLALKKVMHAEHDTAADDSDMEICIL